jgi:hypothetical protein
MKRRAFLSVLGVGVASGGLASANEFAKPPGTKPGGATLDRWHQALAGARLFEITRLREYSATGRFPRNHRIFNRTPIFIDESKTPCAVGYLMQRSGHSALANQIAKTNNHVYIEHIKEGPAYEWILLSGLTQDECARIQPSYNWDRPKPEPRPEHVRLREHFALLEDQLLSATAASLKEAVAKLEPLIASGVTIDRIAR